MKALFLCLSFLLLFSCHTKQEKKTNDTTINQGNNLPLKVTIIANLPDSLKPITLFLDSMPKPLKVTVPMKSGGAYSKIDPNGNTIKVNLEPASVKPLPVLQNENGEPILDKQDKPFLLGNLGHSDFTNFTSDDGLPLDVINCSAMDHSGALWFGTQGGGLSRYNGKSFTNFSIPQGLAYNNVLCITEDKSENLWIGTRVGGVSRYDGYSFTNFSTEQGLANNSVLSILVDKGGNIWFGTDGGGVSCYDGKKFTTFNTNQGLANNTVRCIMEDKAGNLWFGTEGSGVSRFDGKKFTTLTTSQGLASNIILSILEDKSGYIWFATYNSGICRYDGKAFVNFTTNDGLANNFVRTILEDRTGNLWFGTRGGGISQYDGKKFTSFTTAQGLANNVVRCIVEDKTGNLWFGTRGGGLSRYNGKSIIHFSTEVGLADNDVHSIFEDKAGKLWFGTNGGGVSRYDGKAFINYTSAQGLTNNTVNSIYEDKKGKLWFGNWNGGLSYFDGTSFTNYTTAQGLVNNSIWSIFEDTKGNLWLGTDNGLNCYSENKITTFTTAQGLADNHINCILEDKTGNLWFATSGGLSRYDRKSFINFTTEQGLANNIVRSILEDQAGNIWSCTEVGLSVMPAEVVDQLNHLNSSEVNTYPKGLSDRSSFFRNFDMEAGLPDNSVSNIIQMPNGKIAIGTNKGITLFNHSKDFTKLTDLEIYNANTGYPIKDINLGQNSMFLDSKGILWAGNGNQKTNLVRFDYDAINKNLEPPALVLQSIKIKDKNICWYDLQTKDVVKNNKDKATSLLQEYIAYGKTISEDEKASTLKLFGNIQFNGISKFYPIPENLVLPFEHNQISFEFAAIETGKPLSVKYQYILEGYDQEWGPITNRSNANFGNIHEGTYTFKLKAQGANGIWSMPIEYTFRVLPPWYRTLWAYLIYTFLFLSALRIFSKWRESKLRAEKEKLEKTIAKRTEELVEKNRIVLERTTMVEKQKEELIRKNLVIEQERDEADKQRERSDALLLNILPEEVAEELKTKGYAEAKHFDQVTVLFTDIKNFTEIAEKMSPKELVEEIHTCFKAFDSIIEKHKIEKIKTIGDSYMCAGGLPIANNTHASDVVKAGLEIRNFILNRVADKIAQGKEPFQIRIGVHTGPVVAGIVGIKKFAYDIWGDTVNTASRMESSGEVGHVNISGRTYELVKDQFNCIHRGKLKAKGKGELDMYFVDYKS